MEEYEKESDLLLLLDDAEAIGLLTAELIECLDIAGIEFIKAHAIDVILKHQIYIIEKLTGKKESSFMDETYRYPD